MSLWPVSPTNGQTTTVNGIVYTYNTTQTAWVRTGTSSTGDITGANGTFSGNLTVTGNANVGNLGTAQVLANADEGNYYSYSVTVSPNNP